MGCVFALTGTSSTKLVFKGNKMVAGLAYIGAAVGGQFGGQGMAINELYYNNEVGTKAGSIVLEDYAKFYLFNSTVIGSKSQVLLI